MLLTGVPNDLLSMFLDCWAKLEKQWFKLDSHPERSVTCIRYFVAATQREVAVKTPSRCVLLPAGIKLETTETSSSLIYSKLGSSELYCA